VVTSVTTSVGQVSEQKKGENWPGFQASSHLDYRRVSPW